MIKLIDLLNEGKQVGPLYHYTTLMSVYNIVNQNVIRPSMNGFVSFTRSKNRDFGIAQGTDAMMAFDGDKLSNNYKITPYQDYEGFEQGEEEDEMEESVYGTIKNINKYLIKVTIYPEGIDRTGEQWSNKLIDLLKEKNIPYEIVK